MLSAYSWGEFVQGTILILLCYYAAIGTIFYRTELRGFLSGLTSYGIVSLVKKNVIKDSSGFGKEKAAEEISTEPLKQTFQPERPISASPDISKVYAELEGAIVTAKDKNTTRAELLERLGDIIKKYVDTTEGDFRETLRLHIQSQLEIYSFQPLTSQELGQLRLS